MKLVKCSNGHFYDGDKYVVCPNCEEEARNGGNLDLTVTVDQSAAENLGQELSIPEDPDKGEKTISAYTTTAVAQVEPVVGWLVCVKGEDFGKSFTLKNGKNFIGRSEGVNDVVLKKDNSVSREKHAILIFDPKSGKFLAQPGMSSELFYLNEEVVLQAVPLKEKDILQIGKTELIFMPLCGPDFSWETYAE